MQVTEINHLAPLGKSDHSLLTFDFNCYIDYAKPKERFAFDKGDYEAMRRYLSESIWLERFMQRVENLTVEQKWEEFKAKPLRRTNY